MLGGRRQSARPAAAADLVGGWVSLHLLPLPPAIVEASLEGTQPDGMTLPGFMEGVAVEGPATPPATTPYS